MLQSGKLIELRPDKARFARAFSWPLPGAMTEAKQSLNNLGTDPKAWVGAIVAVIPSVIVVFESESRLYIMLTAFLSVAVLTIYLLVLDRFRRVSTAYEEQKRLTKDCEQGHQACERGQAELRENLITLCSVLEYDRRGTYQNAIHAFVPNASAEEIAAARARAAMFLSGGHHGPERRYTPA